MDMNLDREEDPFGDVDKEEPPSSRMFNTMDITNTASVTLRLQSFCNHCSCYLQLISLGPYHGRSFR